MTFRTGGRKPLIARLLVGWAYLPNRNVDCVKPNILVNPESCVNNRKFGFTLAEVLITLGIIGVVAAITMPIVVGKVQWMILKNQYKKVYNTYSNAFQMIINDNDNTPYNCYYGYDSNPNGSGECNKMYNALAKRLNVVKYCSNKALENKCVPKYSKYHSNAGCKGFSENSINNTNSAYVLNDGTIMMMYGSGGALFAIDTNGFKGPNKPGYDFFVFEMKENSAGAVLIEPIYSGCQTLETGGKYGRDMLTK